MVHCHHRNLRLTVQFVEFGGTPDGAADAPVHIAPRVDGHHTDRAGQFELAHLLGCRIPFRHHNAALDTGSLRRRCDDVALEQRGDGFGIRGRYIDQLGTKAFWHIAREGRGFCPQRLAAGKYLGVMRNAEVQVSLQHLDRHTVRLQPLHQQVAGDVHVGRVAAWHGREALDQLPGGVKCHFPQEVVEVVGCSCHVERDCRRFRPGGMLLCARRQDRAIAALRARSVRWRAGNGRGSGILRAA